MKRHMKWFLAACLALAACLLIPAARLHAEPKAFEFLLPEADTRLYAEEELQAMTPQVACFARNEIYARHGRKFRSAELTAWFSEQPWYTPGIEPDDFSEELLNEYETANVTLLRTVEQSKTTDGSSYSLDEEGYTFDEVLEYLYSDFNIFDGLEVYATSATVFMNTEHFSLMLPNNLNWSYQQLDKTSFEIFHKPSRDAEAGGWVVTIKAFDPDDSDYMELPHFNVCGETTEKRYVAVLPTDVQFDPGDPASIEEYRKLLDWAYTLDINAADGSNPFEVVETEEVQESEADTGIRLRAE